MGISKIIEGTKAVRPSLVGFAFEILAINHLVRLARQGGGFVGELHWLPKHGKNLWDAEGINHGEWIIKENLDGKAIGDVTLMDNVMVGMKEANQKAFDSHIDIDISKIDCDLVLALMKIFVNSVGQVNEFIYTPNSLGEIPDCIVDGELMEFKSGIWKRESEVEGQIEVQANTIYGYRGKYPRPLEYISTIYYARYGEYVSYDIKPLWLVDDLA